MPATYEPIATTTLGSAAATITFSSIASSWTDLRLVLIGTSSAGGSGYCRFNSDSGTNYSITYLRGDGSTASSVRSTNYDRVGFNGDNGISTTIPSMATIDIFSYAGSTNKTCLTTSPQDMNGSGSYEATVALWRNTAAITSITLSLSGGNFASGYTATLYGIKNA
jgi:hypothetical protein